MNYIDNVSILLILLIGLFIMYYMFKPKEGFQSSESATNNTPATCLVMVSAYERINNNLQKAKDANDDALVKNIELSLKSIDVEMKNMGC